MAIVAFVDGHKYRELRFDVLIRPGAGIANGSLTEVHLEWTILHDSLNKVEKGGPYQI